MEGCAQRLRWRYLCPNRPQQHTGYSCMMNTRLASASVQSGSFRRPGSSEPAIACIPKRARKRHFLPNGAILHASKTHKLRLLGSTLKNVAIYEAWNGIPGACSSAMPNSGAGCVKPTTSAKFRYLVRVVKPYSSSRSPSTLLHRKAKRTPSLFSHLTE